MAVPVAVESGQGEGLAAAAAARKAMRCCCLHRKNLVVFALALRHEQRRNPVKWCTRSLLLLSNL